MQGGAPARRRPIASDGPAETRPPFRARSSVVARDAAPRESDAVAPAPAETVQRCGEPHAAQDARSAATLHHLASFLHRKVVSRRGTSFVAGTAPSTASSPWWKSGVAPRRVRRPAGKAGRARISGTFERGATPPEGMHRSSNAVRLAPRAASEAPPQTAEKEKRGGSASLAPSGQRFWPRSARRTSSMADEKLASIVTVVAIEDV